MELNKFIENFAAQFEDTELDSLNSETNFRELEEWSSLIALSLIAMVDDEYDITIKGDDVRNSNTINDLYKIVKSKSKLSDV